MKNLFIGFLVLNFLLEGLAAVILISGPQGALAVANADGMMWAMAVFAALLYATRSRYTA